MPQLGCRTCGSGSSEEGSARHFVEIYCFPPPIPIEKRDSLTHEGDGAGVVPKVDIQLAAIHANSWKIIGATCAPVTEAWGGSGMARAPRRRTPDLRFRVLGFRILGFRIQGLGFKI